HNNLVYLFSRDYINYLEAVNPENELKIEGAPIPDVGEDAHLVMLEPTDDGLIAQVQYTDQPDFVTSEVLVYMITHDSPIYAWCKGFPERESPLVPFVCTRLRRLVTSLPGEALVFDLDSREDTPEPVFRYPFPLGDGTVWISCGTDGNIYWAGYNSNSTLLAATDFSGEQVWRWESAGVVSLPRRNPIAPAIISPDGVFLLTPKSLLAIKDGRLKWVFESVRGEFRECTALADGTVLLTTWDTLYRLNDRGEILFSEIMDEPLATPPVVDDKGRAYVASAETLYAIG
ncbi:MAG: PQQ-like beta-propeller repeat protein, partial [Candidatus Zixiibacteriota bacterium]